MILLLLGLALWTALHLLRSAAPDLRQALTDKMGQGSKGLIAVGIIVSVLLMIFGYRSAAFIPIWEPPVFLRYVNNLMMILALYIYFQTATKPGTAWIMGKTKNPQMVGFTFWAVAHLLVNGDLASIILFGGLLAWAVVQIKSSKKVPSLVDRETAKITSPFVHLGLVVVAFLVIATIHILLGYNPFG